LRDVTAAASYLLARAGMPTVLVSQDPVDYGGVSYWIMQLEVLPRTMANLRRGLAAVRLDQRDTHLFGQPEFPARTFKEITLRDSGVYQFEIRYRLTGGAVRFGAVAPGGKWIEQSGPPVEEGGDQVSWFRLGVQAGEPVDLALEADLGPGSRSSFAAAPELSVYRDGSAGSLELFDASVERPDREGNLISNGRFDAGLGGWEWGGGELSVATDCHKGSCVQFVYRGGRGAYIAHWGVASLRPGVVYELKAWIKSASAAPQPWLFGIWDPATGRCVAQDLVSATTQWREVKLQFRSDSSSPVGTEFLKNNREPSALLIDEVVLREAGTPE
jgi:hypothetical protein